MEKTKWNVDPIHSELGFKIKHLMISNVSGTFRNFQVQVETNEDDFSSAVIKVTVEINSISSNNEQRDHHLLASDFFEAEKYPQLIFQSSKVEKEDDDTFYVFGELTMKGITKPVKLTVQYSGITKDPWGGVRAGFDVTGKINRSDWGMSFNGALETGGVILSEEVKIFGELQLLKQVEAVPA